MADSRNSILFGTLANGGSPSNPPFGEIFVKGGFVPRSDVGLRRQSTKPSRSPRS